MRSGFGYGFDGEFGGGIDAVYGVSLREFDEGFGVEDVYGFGKIGVGEGEGVFVSVCGDTDSSGP